MRIVGGTLRGRKLAAPEDMRVRPTADRAREALFSILGFPRFTEERRSLLRDARALDAFCGTGALGLEALSRGAAHVDFLDSDPDSLDLARRNFRDFGLSPDRGRFIRADALFPPAPRAPVTLAFLDPPYGKSLAAPALSALAAAGWLAPGCVAVVETEGGFIAPSGFAELDRRRYGKAEFAILRA
jgi:16S rRNA (guanine966-N2)-methyltransferase